MNYLRLSTLTFTSLLALSACGKSEDTIAERSTDSAASNSLLSYVPTDTPYLMANLEEAPDDVIKDLWKLAQPGLDSIQASFNKANAELEAGTTTAADNPEAQLAHSLFSELDGNLSPEGLEELGFDTNPEYAMYGLGAFPVVRVGLSNSETLRATILRSLAKAGIADSEQEYQGVSFWRLSDDEPGEVPAGVYVSILDSHLAIGIFPIMAEPELLPLFLGLEMPENNDALSRLKKLNKTHGYTAYGSGILDLHRLADQFIRPGTTAARMMAATGEFDPASLTQECVTEIHQIIDNAPMMTMGSTEVSSAAIAVQYRVEMPETLAQKLIGLVSKVPVADEVSDRILEFAFGMRFGPVRDFLLEKATSIVEQPYQCEHLQKLNEQAVASLEKLNQPMPPFVNNFRGIRVSLTELMMNLDSIPENARGHLAVHVEQPQMFVGMAQMFLPDLAELALAPGDSPVLLPESLTQKPGIVAYAAMTDDAIGLAVGEGEDAGLPEFLNRKVGPEGTFLSANYDFETYYNYSDRLMDPSDYGHDQHDDEDNGHAQAAIEFREASRAAMIKMMDRNSTKMRFTTDGLVIDNRVTFKQ